MGRRTKRALGALVGALGRSGEARAAARKALELAPGLPLATAILEELGEGGGRSPAPGR